MAASVPFFIVGSFVLLRSRLLHSALVDLYRRTPVYHSHDADFFAATGTSGAGTCRRLRNSHIIFSNLIQVTLYQTTPSAFKVLEQKLTALALDFDDATFRHVIYPTKLARLFQDELYLNDGACTNVDQAIGIH
jgi:hypothetical protein